MTVATALIAGNDPLPELAAEAVAEALARAGLSHANGILLLLTPEFARNAQAAVHAASCAGKSLQVAGGIVAGVANERSWVFDRPAAAVMVLGDGHALVAADADASADLLCLAAEATLPPPWRDSARRCGLLFQDPIAKNPFPVWQQGRIAPDHRACVAFAGARGHSTVATGLRRLGPVRRIDTAAGFDLARLAGQPALDVLRRELPADYRRGSGDAAALPLPHLWAMVDDPNAPDGAMPRLLPILSANNDGSLTLGDRVAPGEALAFAIRQPIDAERDLQVRLGELASTCPQPDFGLFLSCIGRGPYFYGGDDRDWQLLRERFPGMPFVGGYGSGQIAPVPQVRALQHCVVVEVFAADPQGLV